MCDGGVATWKRSASVSPNAVTQWAVPRSMEPCVCRTALGRSVVPELKTKTASSLDRKATDGGAAPLVRSITAAASASLRSRTASAPRCSASRPTPGPSATP